MLKKLLTYFFCTLGVLFFLLMCAGAYVWFSDAYGVRTLVTMLTSPPNAYEHTEVTGDGIDKHSALNEAQEAALETVDINPENVPSSITPAQETCFVEVLGQSRIDEIKAGESPTPAEILQAGKCLE